MWNKDSLSKQSDSIDVEQNNDEVSSSAAEPNIESQPATTETIETDTDNESSTKPTSAEDSAQETETSEQSASTPVSPEEPK